MSFPTELDAFRAFAASSPKNCVLLLDTYDVRQGIKNAITVAKEMEERGERLAAVRLDSGDLARLAKEARKAFDEADLPYVKISVSNDLDEYTIQSLFAQGAPIDSFGVGTKLATCDPQPSLGGVYKLSATRETPESPWEPVIKLSEQAYKRTIPGVQHIRRYYDAAGVPVGDMIVDDSVDSGDTTSMVDVLDELTSFDLSDATPQEMLTQLVADGHRVSEPESIEVAKARCREAFMHLDPATKRFLNPQTYPVGLERGLARLRNELALEEAKGSGRRSRA
jgi:nicotinate phosphoribosyltransferase